MFTPNKRKIPFNRFFCQNVESSDILILTRHTDKRIYKKNESADKQNVAKDALIQIAFSQLKTPSKRNSQTVPLSIDSWMEEQRRENSQNKQVRQEQENYRYGRNTRSVTTCTGRDKNIYDEYAVLKLKEALKKLESPQKAKDKKKTLLSEHKNELLGNLINKRKIQTKVSDLIRIKECQNFRSTGSSSNFKTRKISTSMQCRVKGFQNIGCLKEPLESRNGGQFFSLRNKKNKRSLPITGIIYC